MSRCPAEIVAASLVAAVIVVTSRLLYIFNFVDV
jgi:hypothetical protein